jgi:predicted CoA-binding protein
MGTRESIRAFLASDKFAVVGASNDMDKFGAQVFAAYLAHGRRVVPVNPNDARVQGHASYPSLRDLPEPVAAVSIVTPPEVTERVVEDAAAAGVKRLWMQPGAESSRAVARARALGIDVIAGGPCLLVEIDRA